MHGVSGLKPQFGHSVGLQVGPRPASGPKSGHQVEHITRRVGGWGGVGLNAHSLKELGPKIISKLLRLLCVAQRRRVQRLRE